MKGASKIDSLSDMENKHRVYLIDLDTKDIPIITEYLINWLLKEVFQDTLKFPNTPRHFHRLDMS